MDLSFTTRTRAVRGARQSSRSGGTSVPQHVDNLIHFWPWRFRVGKSPSFFQGFRLGTMASPISRGIAFSKESGTATLGGVPGCAQDTVERRRASFARENVGKGRVGAPCARLRPSPLEPPSTLYSLRPRTSRRGAARAGGARSAAVGRPHPHLPDREPQAEPPAEGRRRAAAHGAPSPRDAPQVVVVRPVSRRRGAGQRACARGALARCRVNEVPCTYASGSLAVLRYDRAPIWPLARLLPGTLWLRGMLGVRCSLTRRRRAPRSGGVYAGKFECAPDSPRAVLRGAALPRGIARRSGAGG